jgi:hypothetical protein
VEAQAGADDLARTIAKAGAAALRTALGDQPVAIEADFPIPGASGGIARVGFGVGLSFGFMNLGFKGFHRCRVRLFGVSRRKDVWG